MNNSASPFTKPKDHTKHINKRCGYIVIYEIFYVQVEYTDTMLLI